MSLVMLSVIVAALRTLVEARNEVIMQWRYLPRFVVGKIKNNQHSRHSAVKRLGVEDAEAVGLLALTVAAMYYDPTKGYKFSTYAVRYIYNELVEEGIYATTIRTPRYLNMKNPPKRGVKNWDKYKVDQERASACCHLAFETLDPSSVIDKEDEDYGEQLQHDVERINDALAKIPSRLRKAIKDHYYDGVTKSEIGRRMCQTKEAGRLLVDRAINALRRQMSHDEGESLDA